MTRKRSKKKVLTLEECIHPFICTFINNNASKGVFVSSNDETAIYPLHTPVTITRSHYFILKDINKRRGFYNPKEHDYDPFKDPAYL